MAHCSRHSGFGKSAETEPFTFPHLIEWLAALRERLHLPPGALVGHSFGGVLATAYALAYPEDVTRLLLLAPAILVGDSVPEWIKRVSFSMGIIEAGTAVAHSPNVVNIMVRNPFYNPDKQHDSIWERRLEDYADARASAEVVKIVGLLELQNRLDQVKQPCALIWGEKDMVVPAAHGPRLVELLPDATCHTFPECGHVPMIEKLDKFLPIAKEFLLSDR